MLQISDVAVLIVMCATPLFGRAADRVGRKPVYLAGASAAVVLAFPSFWALNSGTFIGASRDLRADPAQHGHVHDAGRLVPELFPAPVPGHRLRVRRAVGHRRARRPRPTIAQALLRSSHGHSWTVSTYIAGVCFTSLIFAALTRKPGRVAGPRCRSKRPGRSNRPGVPGVSMCIPGRGLSLGAGPGSVSVGPVGSSAAGSAAAASDGPSAAKPHLDRLHRPHHQLRERR